MRRLNKPADWFRPSCSVAMALAIVAAADVTLAADYPAIGPLTPREAPAASLVEMGKRLFYDVRISGDGAISCATCHDPEQGFTRQTDKNGEPMALSDAYPGTRHVRSAPTLLNSVYKADFESVGWGWDGHIGANMNVVIRDQITETMMMNLDMRLMHERMKQDPVYVEMCQVNFDGECSSGKGRNALDAFVSTLVSQDVPFDTGTLSAQAQSGQALFEGKAGCIQCHNGPYFSDGQPHNTGVPENLEVFNDPLRHIAVSRRDFTEIRLLAGEILGDENAQIFHAVDGIALQLETDDKVATSSGRAAGRAVPNLLIVFEIEEERAFFFGAFHPHDQPEVIGLISSELTRSDGPNGRVRQLALTRSDVARQDGPLLGLIKFAVRLEGSWIEGNSGVRVKKANSSLILGVLPVVVAMTIPGCVALYLKTRIGFNWQILGR